jgi:hypothetical protein
MDPLFPIAWLRWRYGMAQVQEGRADDVLKYIEPSMQACLRDHAYNANISAVQTAK